ncbi:MAG: molecular chaperone HtpG [Alphaproteobacteria bacterium]
MAEEKLQFTAEVGRVLDIVARSLYSAKDVFLRELISNASDACDRLRYQALTEPGVLAADPELKIRISLDTAARTVTVADNGVGMGRHELIENLGTVARSGTASFTERLTGDAKADLALIGQFGVGFYSAFMVADRVEVTSRKAGESEGWRWSSDGKDSFAVGPADDAPPRGTRVVVHLRPEESEFLERERVRHIVRTYSDHIGLPVVLADGGKDETLNTASALWTRRRSEVSEGQYGEFYRHVAHSLDKPWLTLHFRAEGKIEYTALLFIPSTPPFDLFDPARRARVRLYVRRVFITEECEGLVPGYLRFLKGVIDSEDLPLNISRETIQRNPLVARIRAGLVKRLLGELKRRAETDSEDYARFWDNFGAVLKEGLYEDREHRDLILEAARFGSTGGDGRASLADYVQRMAPGQESILYVAAASHGAAARSPQLEGFRAKGVEVLLLSDPVDEFWIPAVGDYRGKPFRSITRGVAELDKIAAAAGEGWDKPGDAGQSPSLEPLIALLRLMLKGEVKDVRASKRLTDSPACLVADERDPDLNLERLLRHRRRDHARVPRILELNPRHPLILRLTRLVGEEGRRDELEDTARLLLESARVAEGEEPSDPPAFARRLAAVMTRALGA